MTAGAPGWPGGWCPGNYRTPGVGTIIHERFGDGAPCPVCRQAIRLTVDGLIAAHRRPVKEQPR